MFGALKYAYLAKVNPGLRIPMEGGGHMLCPLQITIEPLLPGCKGPEVLPAGSYTWQKGPSPPIEMPEGPCSGATSDSSLIVFHGRDVIEFDANK